MQSGNKWGGDNRMADSVLWIIALPGDCGDEGLNEQVIKILSMSDFS